MLEDLEGLDGQEVADESSIEGQIRRQAPPGAAGYLLEVPSPRGEGMRTLPRKNPRAEPGTPRPFFPLDPFCAPSGVGEGVFRLLWVDPAGDELAPLPAAALPAVEIQWSRRPPSRQAVPAAPASAAAAAAPAPAPPPAAPPKDSAGLPVLPARDPYDLEELQLVIEEKAQDVLARGAKIDNRLDHFAQLKRYRALVTDSGERELRTVERVSMVQQRHTNLELRLLDHIDKLAERVGEAQPLPQKPDVLGPAIVRGIGALERIGVALIERHPQVGPALRAAGQEAQAVVDGLKRDLTGAVRSAAATVSEEAEEAEPTEPEGERPPPPPSRPEPPPGAVEFALFLADLPPDAQQRLLDELRDPVRRSKAAARYKDEGRHEGEADG